MTSFNYLRTKTATKYINLHAEEQYRSYREENIAQIYIYIYDYFNKDFVYALLLNMIWFFSVKVKNVQCVVVVHVTLVKSFIYVEI